MAKNEPTKSTTPVGANTPTSATPEVPLSEATVTKRDVEWYRQCPHCWDRLGGVGTAYKTEPPENSVGVRYYKCDTCGTGFSRDFEVATEVITQRVVRVIRR